MNVNLKIQIKIKSFRKKKVTQKFKTCNCHSVKKTTFFFFFFEYFIIIFFNQGWIPNFSIKLIGRENWSWIWSGLLWSSIIRQWSQNLWNILTVLLKSKWDCDKFLFFYFIFFITDCDKFLSTCRAFLYLILQLRGRWFSYML